MLSAGLIGEWKSGSHSLSLYCSDSTQLTAIIRDQIGNKTQVDSSLIKCGIFGKIPHDL